MNTVVTKEDLQKAIDEHTFLSRARGADSVLTIEARLKMEGLQKAWSEASREAASQARHGKGGAHGEMSDADHIKALTKLHHNGDEMGSGHHVTEVNKPENQDPDFKAQKGDRYVKVSLYDEGKAEGGHSTYAVNNGQVRHAGASGSGPWGIPPGSDRLNFSHDSKGGVNPKSLPTADFHKDIQDEHNHWKDYWKQQEE